MVVTNEIRLIRFKTAGHGYGNASHATPEGGCKAILGKDGIYACFMGALARIVVFNPLTHKITSSLGIPAVTADSDALAAALVRENEVLTFELKSGFSPGRNHVKTILAC